MIILQPRSERVYRTQDEHIAFYKSISQEMMSVPDALELRNNIEAMKEIISDWGGLRYQITSSRIEYSTNTIIHNLGSDREVRIQLKEIPICQLMYLPELLATESGLQFVKAMCNNMKASKEEITKMLEELSTKPASKIKFWTPDQESRNERPVRAVGLFFNRVAFFVVGDYWLDNDGGCSHGVLSDSEAKPKSKIKLNKFTQEEIRESCRENPIAMMEYNKRYHK